MKDKPRVLKYEELDPVIKELCGVCKVPEWHVNGDFAKEVFLAEKYSKENRTTINRTKQSEIRI